MKYITILILLIVLIGGILFSYMSQDKHNIEKIDTPKQSKQQTPIPKTEHILEKKVQNRKYKTLYINREINTTIKTKITLKSNLNKNSKEYNYLWKEGKNIIKVGTDSIQRSFSLGEHNISCQIFDNNTLISQENIRVLAWKYIKKKSYYFDIDTDKYELVMTSFFDNLNRLILKLTEDEKTAYLYNDDNQIVEERYEYFTTPSVNYTMNYTYNGKNLVSEERVNDNGDIIYSYIYDENGNEIKEEDSIEENIIEEDSTKEDISPKETVPKEPIKIYDKDGNLIHFESANGSDKRDFKYKNGRIVYRSFSYSDIIISQIIRYDNKGNEIYKEGKVDKNGTITDKHILNLEYIEGKITRKETKYYKNGKIDRHIVSEWHYKNGKEILFRQEALVGTIKSLYNLVKVENIYHYDKDGNLTYTDEKYQRKGDNKLKRYKDDKIIKTYTNELP